MNTLPFLKSKPKRFLAVDFGRSVLKAAHLETDGVSGKFLAFDAVSLASDETKNKGSAADFLRKFMRDSAVAIKDARAVISVSDAVVIRHIVLPALPAHEVAEAIRWQFGDETPFDVGEATVDWQPLRDYTDEEGVRKMEVLGIMAKTDALEHYVETLSLCGLEPSGITLGLFQYPKLVSPPGGAGPCFAVLDAGHGDASLAVYKNGRMLFARRLAFSSQRLTRSLVGTFISDKTKVELSYDDAERVKRSYGIPEETAGLLEGHLEAAEIYSLLRPHLEELIRELKLSFDYCAAHIEEERPAALYLTGGGARLKNLKGFLEKNLALAVSDLMFPPAVDTSGIDPARLEAWRPQMAALAGLALGRAAVNLLPQKVRIHKIELMEEISLELLGAVLGAVFLVSFAVSRFEIHNYEKRLRDMKEQLLAAEQIRALMATIAPRQDLIERIQKDKIPADGLLKLISHLIPQAMTLDDFSLDQGERSLVLRGKVKGLESAATESVLTGFMQTLEASSFFREAALVSSEKTPEGAVFEIRCDLATS